MEVVQTGPLVCASRPSSSHPPPHARLSHADPTSALHVHTEEGGGGLDPSWWKISASGSWDGGERRMRYGKIIDDRSGSIPGAIQRRKLEMLETHAPGASMRVVHSQSHASWVQDPSDSNSSGKSTSISSSRRSVLSSSSSSTRVTSFRQWSSNFSQNSTNSVGVTQESRPTVTEFGNLQLALNPLDVSFLRTKGNVGRSGSIGSRRPPSRGRRLSTDPPSDSSAGEDHSKTPSPIPKGDGSVRGNEIAKENRVEKSEENSKEVTESRFEWTPSSSKTILDADEKSKFALRLQTVLHRKRSVSSEDVRTGEGTDEEDLSPEDSEGKWRRGASVRRSLPSSEWKAVVAAAGETRQRLRSRDPFKSSSVPALGGISSRRESFVTAESLREMKGRLKHRGSATDSIGRCTTPPENGEMAQGDINDSTKPRPAPFFLRAAPREILPGTKQSQEAQDDRRKSWSVGCRNLAKRSFEEESEGMHNRRRSYAFEFTAEENGSAEDKENRTLGRTLQDGRGDAQREKLWVDTHPYVQNRVNEVLKKWSAISKEEESKGKEEINRPLEKSPMVSRRLYEERKGDSPVKSSSTWLENSDFETNSAEIEEAEFSQATTTCGGRTSLRVNTSKSSFSKEETISSSQEKQESSFSISGEPMEDYMSAHGLKAIDWTDEDAKASSESVKNEVIPAGISVTFSNTDGENNSRHHYSVTHLDSETTKTEGSKVRTSKKVEFSKTEVHFAAESGRFHIVETAGKPPPSNNFRRRRRSPTGVMNVDSGRVGLGSQSAITNGMRFGDSPYEMRLLAGSENVEHAFRNNEDEFTNGEVEREDNRMDGDELLDSKLVPSSNTKTFNDLVIEEERELKEGVRKVSETETSTSTTFLHLGLEEQSEKPRSILRNSITENVPPWKITVKGSDESDNEDSKPKFGGVRLRPVSSTIGHLRVSVTNNDMQEQLNTSSMDKDYTCALSPGQMELQKLLRSLRHVSMTYNDGSTDSNPTVAQVANGGGMEVRISSANSQPPTGTNTVMIGGDSSEVNAPLSVAQRVREVEERRQKELMNKVVAAQKPAPRASGQFSTRVTLGSTSSSIVSMESQVQRKASLSQIENANPVSPKPAENISTQNDKIARIHNAQGITSRLSGDGQQQSKAAATSDIAISALLTEKLSKSEQSKEVPMVTCISLGFQDKLKNGLKYAETREEAKDKPESSSISGNKMDGLALDNRKRISSRVAERKVEEREKSSEALHTRTEKYSVSSLSKDVSSAWHKVDLKNKEQDDHTKLDSLVQGNRSPRRGKELSSDIKEKPNAKQSIVSLGSPITVSKRFQSESSAFQRYKDDSQVDDVTGQFSVKMKVVNNQLEEKSGPILDPVFPSNVKSSTQTDYSHQRKTNTLTTSSKLTETESNTQKGKSSPRVSRESRTMVMQVSKSPVMEQKSKVLTARATKSGNSETSSPSSGRVVRKRLRKRGSGNSSKSISSSDGRKQSIDDESAILEELTKAADEILHAVNGYSDEASSDEDVEASKNESRTKRRQISRKEVTSRKLSSSSSKDPKGGGSLRNSTHKTKESRSRVTNGATSPSAEVLQRIVSETQAPGTEAAKTSHRVNLNSPVSSPKLHVHSCSKAVSSEKTTKSKQHSPLPISKKIMTRVEPTNRVAEVKLIEKRPPLPPAGQRRPSGTKERSEALGRGSHNKVKTTTSLVYNKDGEAEIVKEAKRPLNIARALEAVMPDSRTKSKKIDQKVEVSSALKVSEIQKKVNTTSTSSSAQSSPSATLSMDRKKVASSRDGDKTSRRRTHQNITST